MPFCASPFQGLLSPLPFSFPSHSLCSLSALTTAGPGSWRRSFIPTLSHQSPSFLFIHSGHRRCFFLTTSWSFSAFFFLFLQSNVHSFRCILNSPKTPLHAGTRPNSLLLLLLPNMTSDPWETLQVFLQALSGELLLMLLYGAFSAKLRESPGLMLSSDEVSVLLGRGL